MKYVSIDLETTGLLHEDARILSIGAIIDDLDNPKQYEDLPKLEICLTHERVSGGIFAIDMNRDLIREIKDQVPKPDREYVKPTYALERLMEFIRYHLHLDPALEFKFNVAGKCFATFDDQLLIRAGDISGQVWDPDNNWAKFRRRRILDPAILYRQRGDEKLPNLTECLARAGMEPTNHHNALADAWDVCRLLRQGGPSCQLQKNESETK